MAFKLVILAAIIALSRGGVVGASVVAAAPAVLAKVSDATIDPNPQYSFAYDVQDALTGDSKSQVESRANGVVRGQYTVADPDGTRRIVDYYADPVHGFNAVVRKTPQAVVAPVVAKAAPVVAPAPLAPAPLLSRAVAAPLLARAVAPGYAPLAAPAPLAVAPGYAPLAAPAPLAVAPGYAPLAAPAPLAVAPGYAPLAAPAPFAVAPRYAPLAAPAPLAVAPGIARVASPFVAAPPFARVASPYAVW